MKSIIKSALWVSLVLISVTVSAQKMTEGEIVYKMKMEGGQFDNPMLKSSMANSLMTLKFKNQKSVMETNMAGGMMKMRLINNSETQEGIMLMDAMGKKIAMKVDPKKEGNKEDKKRTIEVFKNETKKIAGYSCHKVICKTNEATVELYVTKEIKVPAKANSNFGGVDMESIDGFPMETILHQEEATVTTTVTEINRTPQNDEQFSLVIPEGYEIKTSEELGGLKGLGGM
jgi:hypothetical protein